jgi:hypothetical protein
MSACDDAGINISWQWDANSPPQNQEYVRCPASAIDGYWRAYHFDPQQGTLVENWPNPEVTVLNMLITGQKGNQGAQNSYKNCLAQTGVHAFARLIVTAAPGQALDLGAATPNIAWQKGANPHSIDLARSYWSNANAVADGAARMWFATLAADCLMGGQLHNPPVLKIYRACFRDDPNGLFAIVLAP